MACEDEASVAGGWCHDPLPGRGGKVHAGSQLVPHLKTRGVSRFGELCGTHKLGPVPVFPSPEVMSFPPLPTAPSSLSRLLTGPAPSPARDCSSVARGHDPFQVPQSSLVGRHSVQRNFHDSRVVLRGHARREASLWPQTPKVVFSPQAPRRWRRTHRS